MSSASAEAQVATCSGQASSEIKLHVSKSPRHGVRSTGGTWGMAGPGLVLSE